MPLFYAYLEQRFRSELLLTPPLQELRKQHHSTKEREVLQRSNCYSYHMATLVNVLPLEPYPFLP